jgi:NAD(P)-dependent dehydrogenase (short-subunit alcohol dehydrogenase family)
MDQTDKQKYSEKEIDKCINILFFLFENSEDYAALTKEKQIELLKVCGQLSRPDRHTLIRRNKAIRKKHRQDIVAAERSARAETGIRKAREVEVFSAPLQLLHKMADTKEKLKLNSPRNCYVCKAEFTQLHFFYDSMCPECAELNYKKRFQTTNLTGQVAVITGSRLKIGYQATLMMLRAGATVIATTRFPVDSAIRYSKEDDFGVWANRLHIYGLDLRHTPSVEIFCGHIERKYQRLDILINNAAQTVRRPPEFYAHLMSNETKLIEAFSQTTQKLLDNYLVFTKKLWSFSVDSPGSELTQSGKSEVPGIGLVESAKLSQIPYGYDKNLTVNTVFPKGELDLDLQQVDLRETNSWRLKLGEIQTSEMLELQLVNAIAPFVLCNKLAPLMGRDNTGQKHIVNVSAMEGKFLRFKKGDRHPHTNMAKAALNMLTHTSASGLAKNGVFMNAVDTGWVTDEDPVKLSKLKEDIHDFQPPLDIVDGAARVCDPLFNGINTGKHYSGKFLKDYFPIDW